jgi:hypothetical protein
MPTRSGNLAPQLRSPQVARALDANRTRPDVMRVREPGCGTLVEVADSDQKGYVDWDRGREGYIASSNKFIPVVAIPKPPKRSGEGNLLSIRAEERIASLIAAGGMIWAVYIATVDYANLWRMQIMPPGPVEVWAVGILTWLHAKWRKSLKN